MKSDVGEPSWRCCHAACPQELDGHPGSGNVVEMLAGSPAVHQTWHPLAVSGTEVGCVPLGRFLAAAFFGENSNGHAASVVGYWPFLQDCAAVDCRPEAWTRRVESVAAAGDQLGSRSAYGPSVPLPATWIAREENGRAACRPTGR